jgi:energy-coupling factor transporter ATP-binding protein EcfA2
MSAQGDDVTVLLPELAGLRDEVAATRLPLGTPGRGEARRTQERLVRQVAGYLLPRLERLESPALVVVAGPTGGGKSTLVNTLAGRVASPAGVLRPTTRAPVLVCHPDDEDAFTDDRVLPALRRTDAPGGEPATLHVATSTDVPAGVALLDAPDLDSVVAENRTLARELLDCADVWVCVLSAARYADAVPWEALDAARDRGAAVTMVLSRVEETAAGEVTTDLARMLVARGPDHTPLFVVPECTPTPDGLLPGDATSVLAGWLAHLAGDWDARARLVQRTILGTLDGLRDPMVRLATEADAQAEAWVRLRREADDEHAGATTRLQEAARDGTVLGGGVPALWERSPLGGDAEGPGAAGARGLLGRVVAGRRRTSDLSALREALDTGLVALVLARVEEAARRTDGAWRRDPAGEALLSRPESPAATGAPGLHDRVTGVVAAWHDATHARLDGTGTTRRSARRHPLDETGLALAVAVAALGADVGTGVASRARGLLAEALGQDRASPLVAGARDDLDRRLADVLAAERARYTGLLDRVQVDPRAGEALRAALAYVERVR